MGHLETLSGSKMTKKSSSVGKKSSKTGKYGSDTLLCDPSVQLGLFIALLAVLMVALYYSFKCCNRRTRRRCW